MQQKTYSAKPAAVTQLPGTKPAEPVKQPEPAPVVVRKHASFPREVWVLLVFVSGLVLGAVGTLSVTTSLFPIATSATQDAFIAGQVAREVSGKR